MTISKDLKANIAITVIAISAIAMFAAITLETFELANIEWHYYLIIILIGFIAIERNDYYTEKRKADYLSKKQGILIQEIAHQRDQAENKNTKLSNEAKELKDKINEMQSQHFIDQAVIHDMKNCLIGIRMLALTESAKGGLKHIIDQILNYANQYIEYSKQNLVANKLMINTFSVLELLRKIKKEKNLFGGDFVMNNQADLKAINNFSSNEELIRIIVSELIDNAIKAETKEGFVKVDVSFEDDWLQIVISNHGHIDQVSNFLDQPSPASGDNTGVGVYLINKLVTRTLGGQIELLHNYNQQVRIALKIPQFKTSTF